VAYSTPPPNSHLLLPNPIRQNMDREPLDPEYVAEVLSRPPFVTISGVHNVRDIAAPGSLVKPNLVFRGAEVSSITEEGEHCPVFSINVPAMITAISFRRQGPTTGARHYYRVRFAIRYRDREMG
jgi:hypothetical protein